MKTRRNTGLREGGFRSVAVSGFKHVEPNFGTAMWKIGDMVKLQCEEGFT